MTEMAEGKRTIFLAAAAVLVLFVLAACNADRDRIEPTSGPTAIPEPDSGNGSLTQSTPRPTPSLLTATLAPTSTPTPSSLVSPGGDVAVTPVGTPSVTPQPTPTVTPTEPPRSVTTLVLPDVAGVVERVRPAVVSVVAEVLLEDFLGRTFRDAQSGSGVIFDSVGYLLTNNHVVQDAESVTVTLDDGSQFRAEVVGADQLTDLAVLKIAGTEFPAVPLADPSEVRVGDWVIAIGNALALPGGPTVTVGVVSALDRSFEVSIGLELYGLIQTDASINPGNSGGPLLNLGGEVVGINTAVARGDSSGRQIEGIGFAVGMDTAASVALQLIEDGRVRWAWLGALLRDLDPQLAAEVGVQIREGVLVAQLVRDGPAWRSGAQAGDVIVSFDGVAVPTVKDLIKQLRQELDAGQTVEVKLFREKKELTLDITLGERPQQ